MILIKDKDGKLKLIANQSIEYYEEAKILKICNNLPNELRRTQCCDTLEDIYIKQRQKLHDAIDEAKLRKKLMKILNELLEF